MKELLALGLLLAFACDSHETLSGTRISTDHFSENRGSGEVVGDVQMTAVTSGDIITVSFAPPAADWKDPRGQHLSSEGRPQRHDLREARQRPRLLVQLPAAARQRRAAEGEVTEPGV